jgi:hypothetical protein
MTIRITTAAQALAQIKARSAVKDQLRHQGLKVTDYAAKDISVMANKWLIDHYAEMLPGCIEQARSMMLSGSLGRRAQKTALAQLGDLETCAQLAQPIGKVG